MGTCLLKIMLKISRVFCKSLTSSHASAHQLPGCAPSWRALDSLQEAPLAPQTGGLAGPCVQLKWGDQGLTGPGCWAEPSYLLVSRRLEHGGGVISGTKRQDGGCGSGGPIEGQRSREWLERRAVPGWCVDAWISGPARRIWWETFGSPSTQLRLSRIKWGLLLAPSSSGNGAAVAASSPSLDSREAFQDRA